MGHKTTQIPHGALFLRLKAKLKYMFGKENKDLIYYIITSDLIFRFTFNLLNTLEKNVETVKMYLFILFIYFLAFDWPVSVY